MLQQQATMLSKLSCKFTYNITVRRTCTRMVAGLCTYSSNVIVDHLLL